MKEFFSGWPFRTWKQGYVLGLINGAIIGVLFMSIFLFLEALK